MTSTAAGVRANGDSRLFTLTRQREAARIVVVTALTALYGRGVLPFPPSLLTLGLGLYPVARAGFSELWREQKIGTELFAERRDHPRVPWERVRCRSGVDGDHSNR